jgi:5'-deoxynucleotidase YfbR-like HD superfamily hydrolase
VGDITPYCGVDGADKHAQEAAAVVALKAMLGGSLAGEEIEALWWEYERGESEEAKLVKDFDKVRSRGDRSWGGWRCVGGHNTAPGFCVAGPRALVVPSSTVLL